MRMDARRRKLLGAMLAGAPIASMADVARLCAGDPAISDPGAPLTIDTHTHIFNGSDLQVREFTSQTTVGRDSELYPFVRAMTAVLQRIAWHAAPSAAQERAALAKYANRLQKCDQQAQWRRAAYPLADAGYRLGRREMQLAADGVKSAGTGVQVLGATDVNKDLTAAIESLPATLEEFESDSKPAVLRTNPSLVGFLRFVLHHFNYRHVNAIEYLTTYSPKSPRKIDLAVASLVDFDYWLSKGRATPTSLADQVEMMSEISVLLGGRVHGFVPYCPFREIMTQGPAGSGNAMRLVKDAIEHRGFIGVKLYPPMGFAPMGNAGKLIWKDKPGLDPAAWRPEFGQQLDNAMSRLFDYCQEYEVPIMAHSNDSNGPYETFRKLAGSEYWKLAIEKFPGLRVSFGHFGDSDIEDRDGADSRPFLDLMTPGPDSVGRNIFADSGFFAGAMFSQGKMRDTLLALYGRTGRIMTQRLMYGSDWHMILTQEKADNYLADFIELMGRVEGSSPKVEPGRTSLSDAFFGQNAAEFLGLRSNRGNRKRLERFYARHEVERPDWMRKLA